MMTIPLPKQRTVAIGSVNGRRGTRRKSEGNKRTAKAKAGNTKPVQ